MPVSIAIDIFFFFFLFQVLRSPVQVVSVNDSHDLEMRFSGQNLIQPFEEMPALERLDQILSGKPHFKIVTIIYRDDLDRASQYLKQNGYTFPVYINSDETAPGLFRDYRCARDVHNR